MLNLTPDKVLLTLAIGHKYGQEAQVDLFLADGSVSKKELAAQLLACRETLRSLRRGNYCDSDVEMMLENLPEHEETPDYGKAE